ncbi:MAG TPA: ATP-binding protein [Vicinamibacterales bacterium]|jgi:predicted AAA+ superfamily ATPase|nr:ATP-binding protein [Vicinamibacterales bacterium]
MWIPRDLTAVLERPALPVRVLVGPRQTGKSSLLARFLPDATWLSLDDLHVRQRAHVDPALLLDSVNLESGRPLILDEAAQAPNLFPEIKRRVDDARRGHRREPDIWITGSNRVLLDGRVRESLAGRANYFFLHSLSVAELGDRASLPDWFTRGGFPELYVRPEIEVARYLDDYVRTFVEKDVAASAGILQIEAFGRALQLLAARTGTLLNATDIGQAAGVKGQTVTAWLDVLQQNALALRLAPYHANLGKRVVRTPKIYFLDVGLAAHLQGWRAAGPLLASPHAGPLFETLVLGELVRARDHRGLPIDIYFWRTKEGEEIDFLLEAHSSSGPRWLAIEAKLAIQNVSPIGVPRALLRQLPEVRDIWIVTPGGQETRLSPTSIQLPIQKLAERLADALR